MSEDERPECFGLWERALVCAACPHAIDCVHRSAEIKREAEDS